MCRHVVTRRRRRRRRSTSVARRLQMLGRHLLNATTRHLYTTATIRVFFPRRPCAGSSETRQQCARTGRGWQSPRRFLLLCVTSITRGLLCLSPRCKSSFSSLPQIRSDGRNDAAATAFLGIEYKTVLLYYIIL